VVPAQTSAQAGISERDQDKSECSGNACPTEMVNHGRMWRSVTDRHTESIGENKPNLKQEIAKKLVRAKC